MPVFLDVHRVPFSEARLKELCLSPVNEFGVRHVNLFYNKDAGVCFCLLDGPDIDAIEKHHAKFNIKCEWISEVSLAAPLSPDNLEQVAMATDTSEAKRPAIVPSITDPIRKAEGAEGWNLPAKKE